MHRQDKPGPSSVFLVRNTEIGTQKYPYQSYHPTRFSFIPRQFIHLCLRDISLLFSIHIHFSFHPCFLLPVSMCLTFSIPSKDDQTPEKWKMVRVWTSPNTPSHVFSLFSFCFVLIRTRQSERTDTQHTHTVLQKHTFLHSPPLCVGSKPHQPPGDHKLLTSTLTWESPARQREPLI